MSDDKNKVAPAKLRAPGKYRVLEWLRYPANDDDLEARLKGMLLDDAEIAWRRVDAGEIVDDIPTVSVTSLLANGQIVQANSAGDPYAKPAAKEGVSE